MSHVFRSSLLLVALVAAAPALAQDDPIAAELAQPRAPGTGGRNFSPAAISDLLKQDAAALPKPGAAKSETPKAEMPKADSATPRPAKVALPRALDVPVEAPRSAPDRALATARAPLSPEAINAARFGRVSETSKSVDPVVLKAEILLDRNHAPPGVIDGRWGSNLAKAITTFEIVRGLPVDGKLTRRVWDELGADTAAPVLVPYTITAQDVVGPFYPDLSPDYAEEAKMPDLGYRSPEEMFGERFHMDKRFLKALNPGVDMGVAGSRIVVAEVAAMPIASRIDRIDVDKAKGQVQAYDRDGNLIVAYPATIGSDELPSPSGSWAVRGVAPHPTYTYDPKKNFQQGKNVNKLILPPGPNNPVGAAFIALTKPTYGIHGTPDPSKIDKTRSHGCVRLTNWNAQELAALVRPGIPVNFLDKPGQMATDGGAPPAAEPDIASVLSLDQAGADRLTR